FSCILLYANISGDVRSSFLSVQKCCGCDLSRVWMYCEYLTVFAFIHVCGCRIQHHQTYNLHCGCAAQRRAAVILDHHFQRITVLPLSVQRS
uniref:Uncharacterized protein n=1 Tax=Sinocyclocheilus rhinocerous TaxID=307959 RepID=A0A673JX90_9TELE